MEFARRQVQVASDLQTVPMPRKHELACTVEDLDGGPAPAGMGGKFLALGEDEKDHPQLGSLKDGPADNACRRSLARVIQFQGAGLVRRKQCLGGHILMIARVGASRLDVDQADFVLSRPRGLDVLLARG